MTAPPAVVIEARRSAAGYAAECWARRDLVLLLARRDLAARYKETLVGAAWAVARPAVTLAVFVLVFGRWSRLPSEGVPYPLFVLAAILPWQFLSAAVSESSQSLVGNAALVTKVYFPRILVPTAGIATALTDFFVSLVLYAGMCIWYGVWPTAPLSAVGLLLLSVVLALGAGWWVAALAARYRDVRFLVPFVLQIAVLVSPVGFSSRVVPDEWRTLFALNPLVGLIDGWRWALVGAPPPALGALLWSASAAVLLAATAVSYFQQTERTLADVL